MSQRHPPHVHVAIAGSGFAGNPAVSFKHRVEHFDPAEYVSIARRAHPSAVTQPRLPEVAHA